MYNIWTSAKFNHVSDKRDLRQVRLERFEIMSCNPRRHIGHRGAVLTTSLEKVCSLWNIWSYFVGRSVLWSPVTFLVSHW